jgi:hypothetical protein
MLRSTLLITVSLLLSSQVFAGDPPADCVPGQVTADIAGQYTSLRTGYYPNGSRMEGGFKDRAGKPLRTLQDYLKGKTKYVSVAMDYLDKRLPYGTLVRIPEIEREFGECIPFRIVDTGGRFKGKGTKKIDICTDNRQRAVDDIVNGPATIFVLKKNAVIAN